MSILCQWFSRFNAFLLTIILHKFEDWQKKFYDKSWFKFLMIHKISFHSNFFFNFDMQKCILFDLFIVNLPTLLTFLLKKAKYVIFPGKCRNMSFAQKKAKICKRIFFMLSHKYPMSSNKLANTCKQQQLTCYFYN